MKRKIVFFVHSTVGYGANKALIELIDFLIVNNFEIMVIGSDDLELALWLKERGIRYRSVNSRLSVFPVTKVFLDYLKFFPRFFYHVFRNSIAVFLACKEVRIFSADVIHTNIGPYNIGYYVSRILRIPHVWHVREYQKEDFDLNYFPSVTIFRKRLSRSEASIFITPDLFLKFGSPESGKVIYDSVKFDKDIINEDIELPEKFFLFCGRLEKTKGIEDVIISYKKFVHEFDGDEDLVILGDGSKSYLQKLANDVSDLNLVERVHFLGYKTNVELIMQRATALVVASRFEGFGRITIEAMLAGCPLVAYCNGGTKEIIRLANDQGLTIRHYFDSVECAIQMYSISNSDSGKILEETERLKDFAVAKFAVERLGSEVMMVYNDV